MYSEIQNTITTLQIEKISIDRKVLLQSLINYLQSKIDKKEAIQLNFICTHNSRRSHLSQIWAQTLASHYQVNQVACYSGGTEATAMFAKVSETLQKQGFKITKLSKEDNPVYAVKFDKNSHPIICFSKTYDAAFNPSNGFGAIMTCDSANEACPMVIGAEERFPITYEDPKKFDNTPLQDEKYLERSLQIATELKYVFSALKS